MRNIPLAAGDYRRATQDAPALPLVNRYYEQNPALTEGVSLVARPALRRWVEVGAGPIRKVYSQSGTFDDDLFVASGDEIYRVKRDGSFELLMNGFYGASLTSAVEMVATIAVDLQPSYLFFCAGRELFVYDGTAVTQVVTPDDVGVKSLCLTSNYVIVVPAQGAGKNGRFYWIEPGDITIDPINFATAERSPDAIYQAVPVGDQFWLPGPATTEVWYASGESLAPFIRFQGRTFESGVVDGTALQVGNTMLLVDSDGSVLDAASGFEKVSNPSIEERIRKAINRSERGL